MANKDLTLSDDGLEKLKGEEAVIDGLYEDVSGYCTAGVGHLVHQADKWGCFLLTAALADDTWKPNVSKKWPGTKSELSYLTRTTAFKDKFADLKAKAVDVAKLAVATKKYGKTFDKLSEAEQGAATAAAQSAVDEQAKVLAKTPNDLLQEDLKPYEKAVRDNITAVLTQQEYDALVSLCYNIGPGAFGSSDVTKEVNKNKHRTGEAKDRKVAIDAIEKAFGRYNKSKGVVVDDLTKRRKRESDRFLTGARTDLAEMEKKTAVKPGAPAPITKK
jgi:GH24 family phage-related lysozyme (muramidase)